MLRHDLDTVRGSRSMLAVTNQLIVNLIDMCDGFRGCVTGV